MNDRLYRSRDERIFAGVAGGVAERFDLDPSLVRVVWVILMFLTGSLFFWLYVVMAIVVPEAPSGADRWAAWTTASEPGPGTVPGWSTSPGTAAFASTGPPSGAAGSPESGSAPEAGSIPDGGTPDVAQPGAPPPSVTGSSAPAPLPPPSGSSPPPGWSPTERDHHRRGGGGPVIGGIVLILLGGYFLLRTLAPELDFGAFWPVVLIVIGIALLVGSIRPGRGDGG
jgi:phage shock protein PspC (stress-responsive transcriptional regulator)